jgi:hypothetical protein
MQCYKKQLLSRHGEKTSFPPCGRRRRAVHLRIVAAMKRRNFFHGQSGDVENMGAGRKTVRPRGEPVENGVAEWDASPPEQRL